MTILGHKVTNIQMHFQILIWRNLLAPSVILGELNLSSKFPDMWFANILSFRDLFWSLWPWGSNQRFANPFPEFLTPIDQKVRQNLYILFSLFRTITRRWKPHSSKKRPPPPMEAGQPPASLRCGIRPTTTEEVIFSPCQCN